MSPELHILRDLIASQATADSIAQRVKLPTLQVTAILVALKRENKVTSEPLGGMAYLHVYRLTPETKKQLTTTS